MKGKLSTELGNIVIDPDVIATYAGSVAEIGRASCRERV